MHPPAPPCPPVETPSAVELYPSTVMSGQRGGGGGGVLIQATHNSPTPNNGNVKTTLIQIYPTWTVQRVKIIF